MKISKERRVVIAGFSLAMLLTGLSGYVSYLNAIQLQQSIRQEEQVDTLLFNLTDLNTEVLNVESQRGNYLSDRDEEAWTEYNTMIQTLVRNVHQLRLRLANNPSQYQRLVALESLISEWRSFFSQILHQYPTSTPIQKLPEQVHLKNHQIRTKIQQLIAEMQTSEEQKIQQSIEQDKSGLVLRFAIDLLTTLLSFIVLSSLFILHHQQMKKRRRAEIARQQAEAQQRILAQEKELSEQKLHFFSMASHEFRTPLSLILGSAQLLNGDIQDWSLEKKQTNLERIQSAAKGMNQLLTDMLTLTRAEVGKLEFNPTPIDIESFCLNLIEDFQTLNRSDYQIQFLSSSYCASAFLDEKLLYSILSNLLSNAIKYSPPGSTIQFNLSCPVQRVIFQIQDQGIGIPTEAQQNLYTPFHRGSNVGMIDGNGLGLAVVKKCVDLHQGQIAIESEVGVGTTITVQLPSNTTNNPAISGVK